MFFNNPESVTTLQMNPVLTFIYINTVSQKKELLSLLSCFRRCLTSSCYRPQNTMTSQFLPVGNSLGLSAQIFPSWRQPEVLNSAKMKSKSCNTRARLLLLTEKRVFIDGFLPQFNRCITSQLIKWFSNFREFYYIQMEKFARQAINEGVTAAEELTVGRDAELFRALNMHYNKANDFEVRSGKWACGTSAYRVIRNSKKKKKKEKKFEEVRNDRFWISQ